MSFDTPLAGTAIIIDIGSAYIKVGFAGSTSGPRYVFPCITGTEKYKAVMADVSTRAIYIGDDAMKMRGVLKIKHPIQRGNIIDWNDYYEILNYIFYTILRLENLSFYPIIYIDNPFVQRETKEYIAKVLFETHKAQSLVMVPSPLLSLFSVGLKTGLVVESGDGTTWVCPIINGQIYYNATQRLNLGGYDVNQNLMALLMREGIHFSSSAADEILREIKEKNCYFILDESSKPTSGEKTSFPLPDGTSLTIPNHVISQAPEVMFQPAMLGYNMNNVPQAIIQSLRMVSNDVWGELLSHIVLSGGNCSYSGFEERLKQELEALLPQLGPIPKSQVVVPEAPSLKLQPIDIAQKQEDNCPQCGELVDLSKDKEFCPSCGAKMSTIEISLDLGLGSLKKEKKTKKTKKGKCPHCNKSLPDDASTFCPFCGKSVDKLPSLDEIEQILEAKFSIPSIPEFASENDDASDEIIKLYVPDSVKFAIFNGAAVLGALPSFKSLFITHGQFQSDSNLIYKDFSHLLG